MSQRLPRLVMVLLLAGLSAASAGCYSRVIRAEGPGSDTIDTYEPNSKGEPDLLDDIMWGEQPKKKESR